MGKRILVVDGHPDPDPARLCHALASAYGEGARAAGHDVRKARICDDAVSPVASAAEFARAPTGAFILKLQEDVMWADHLVFVFPLFLGTMPAKLHAALEQMARGGFVAEIDAKGWRPKLKGKSARIVVTMGMPALAYRTMFGAHGVRGLERSILGFAGAGPIRETLIGMAGDVSALRARTLFARMRALGARAR